MVYIIILSLTNINKIIIVIYINDVYYYRLQYILLVPKNTPHMVYYIAYVLYKNAI